MDHDHNDRRGANAGRPRALTEPSGYPSIAIRKADKVSPGIDELKARNRAQPGSAGAWRATGHALLAKGSHDEANAAFARSITASFADRDLAQAAADLGQDKLEAGEQKLTERLARAPDDIVAMRMLAELRMRQRRFPEAERNFRRCLSLAPVFGEARHGLAMALFRQARLDEAANEARGLLAMLPTDPRCRNLMAACAASTGDYHEAIALYRGLLAERPAQPGIWLALGHALRTVGDIDRAVSAYKRAHEMRPKWGEPYWSLANLKSYRFGDEEIAEMRTLLENDPAVEDRVHLHFALGKASEDVEDYTLSFEHYEAGNRAQRSRVSFDIEAATNALSVTTSLLCDPAFRALQDQGHDASEPIFVVGLPRSGTTLVEQILASHPLVEGVSELPYIEAMAVRLGWSRPALTKDALLASLKAVDLAKLGIEYVQRAAAHRKSDRAIFVDKAPANHAFIPLIRLILPRAKIIDVRRDARANCFSLYKQLFSGSAPFSYDLADLGAYNRAYLALTDTATSVFPDAIHTLMYEKLVEDQEGETRRLLDFCNLPFSEDCLRFHESKRPVYTPSSEQVRQPISPGALTHWEKYRAWLAPLEQSLAGVDR